MQQVKPASGRKKTPLNDSHLPRPTVTSAAGVRRGPDPTGHARALVQSHGLNLAVEIAKSNAVVTKERYWQEVFEAMPSVSAELLTNASLGQRGSNQRHT